MRYVSPINPAVYPHLSLVLMTMGFFFMAWFFVYPFQIRFITSFPHYFGSHFVLSIVISRLVQ